VPGGPLADAVEGLAGDEEVLDEDQQPGGGGDPAASVLAGQVVAEDVPEAKSPKDLIEDRQGGDAPGGQGPAGGVGRLAGSWCGGEGIWPMAWVLIHGSPPMLLSRHQIERPFRSDLRRHVCPGRGIVKGSKISCLTCIKMPRRKSRAARLTLAASVVSPCEKGRDRTLDIAPE
jgi:hypothetical protein